MTKIHGYIAVNDGVAATDAYQQAVMFKTAAEAQRFGEPVPLVLSTVRNRRTKTLSDGKPTW